MKSIIKAMIALLTIMFFFGSSFGQAPLQTTSNTKVEKLDRKTCVNRAVDAFAKNKLTVNKKDGYQCSGSDKAFAVIVNCDECGSGISVYISVATNENMQKANQLKERILDQIKSGTIDDDGSLVKGESKLWLDRNRFEPGETITVRYTAPDNFAANAWVGILPANISHGSEAENDKHELTYQYLNKRTSGTLTFTAPSTEGNFDFRMHDTDDNGKEVAHVDFTVARKVGNVEDDHGDGKASLKLEKSTFTPGETITVRYTAPGNFAANAWVGILPANISHGSEAENDKHDLTYQYLNKRTSGTLSFVAPSQRGNYDFRMHDTDDNGKEITHVDFRVQ